MFGYALIADTVYQYKYHIYGIRRQKERDECSTSRGLTYCFSFYHDAAMNGDSEDSSLALKLVKTAGKVLPLSVDVLYKISLSVLSTSVHTIYTLLPEVVISGLNEFVAPKLLLRFFITFGNVLPPSTDLLYKISILPDGMSSHTTCTILPDTAIAGKTEFPELLLRFFIGSVKLAPPSVLRL